MLLDTSGLLCFLDVRDPRNKQATLLFNSALERVTHNYVIAELIALAHARKLNPTIAIQFAIGLLTNMTVELVWVTPDLHRRALDLLNTRPDKSYSLCDAVIFLVMQDRGIRECACCEE